MKQLDSNYENSTGLPDPYDSNIDSWAGLLGAAGFAKKSWRNATAIMFIFAAVGWGMFAYMAVSGQFRVATIQVDQAGRTSYVGSNTAIIPGKPENEQTAWFLREWVNWVYSVPRDQVIYGNNIRRAQKFLTGNGLSLLKKSMAEDPPDQRLARGLILIEVTGVHHLGENEWVVDFIESEFRQGNITAKSSLSLRLNTVFIPPENEEALSLNPISTYIDVYSITKNRSR